ncbi:hypothetical protein KP509_34G023100 [Ceratopteris richardii]|uniref:PPM-type phosphatase domain-containing protein n=1 Tax=Ceratopteris richardii TaxID=49495 RepID=A0A8T2QIN3_CERRI|nr:hypothetical protein KP509_34G023100 [Ceratopteris richardii]
MGMCMSAQKQEKKELRRLAKQMQNAEDKAAQLLADMPGRLCCNGATENSSIHIKQGCKGINQDSALTWEGFTEDEGSVFLGVFYGHGPNGHLVANKVRDCLPSLLTLPIQSLLEEGHENIHHHVKRPIKIAGSKKRMVYVDNGDGHRETENMNHDDIDKESDWIEEKLIAAFHKMDERLRMHPKISCMSSGATAIAMLIQGKDLIVGSIGDSRAILASRSTDGTLVAYQLTMDLKPNSEGEKERIEKHNGRVFALPNEPHIPRFWLPHANTPGLAMSRAFGDFCLKEHGLIATPQIIHRNIMDEDEFIVLATDGVWDVLSHEEVMDVILSSPCKEEAAKCVVDAARNAWERKNWSNRMDDCAAVCHFLKDKLIGPLTSQSRAHELRQGNHSPKHEDVNTQTQKTLARYDAVISPIELPQCVAV